MFIGRGGRNTRSVFDATAAKLRIRGRGSGHLEVDCGNGRRKEAPVPLMVAVTANKGDPEGFRKAIEMTLERLKEVWHHYAQFCEQRNLPQPLPTEPVFSFGEISRGSDQLLMDLLLLHPHPGGPKPPQKVTPGGIVPAGLSAIADGLAAVGNGAPPAANDAAIADGSSRPKRVRTRATHHKEPTSPAEPAGEVAAAASTPGPEPNRPNIQPNTHSARQTYRPACN